MSVIFGLSFSLAIISMVTYFAYPDSTFGMTRKLLIKRPIKQNRNLSSIWPDVVDDLASAIRAGLSLPQAMVLLADSGPEAIRPMFSQAMKRYQVSGDFVGSLELLSGIAQDPIADKFASAIQIAYEVGGTDLGNLLRTLSEVIREDNKLRGEIDARQSWTVNGARLAIAAPWFTVLILGTRQSAANVYLSSQGLKLLMFCAAISVLAYFSMTRIGRLPSAERIRV